MVKDMRKFAFKDALEFLKILAPDLQLALIHFIRVADFGGNPLEVMKLLLELFNERYALCTRVNSIKIGQRVSV